MLRKKQPRTFIRLVLLILLLDAMVNAMPAAFAMAVPSGYLNESTTLLSYFKRFFQALLFHSIIYILFLWWISLNIRIKSSDSEFMVATKSKPTQAANTTAAELSKK